MPRDPSDENEQRIVEKHAGLVRALVGRTLRLYTHLPGSFEREDLECYGRIGLLHAARTYDDNRGVKFSTYAYKCIQNQIVGALDRAVRTTPTIALSLDDFCRNDEETRREELLSDEGIDAEEAVLQHDDRRRLLAAVRQLDPLSSTIVEKIYFQDASITEVARETRMSAYRVQTLLSRALKILRRRLDASW